MIFVYLSTIIETFSQRSKVFSRFGNRFTKETNNDSASIHTTDSNIEVDLEGL